MIKEGYVAIIILIVIALIIMLVGLHAADNNVNELQNTPIDITNTVYGAASDRVLDVRTGASIGIAAQIFNALTSADPILFTIQASNYGSQQDDLSDIPEDTWTELEAETSVAVDAKSLIFEYFRATPAITAIRIRLRVDSGSATVTGIVGWF